jgi:hypothetical protein
LERSRLLEPASRSGIFLWGIKIAPKDLSQATLPRRLPALSQPQPKSLVIGVASSGGNTTQFIGSSPEQVYAQLFLSLPACPPTLSGLRTHNVANLRLKAKEFASLGDNATRFVLSAV